MSLARRTIELKVTHRKCPGCHNKYAQDIVIILEGDPPCIVCGLYKLSQFTAVYQESPLKPKRQQ